MANWTTPSLTDLYTNFLAFLKDRDVDLAKAFDPAKITTYPTNIPTDTVRWNSAAFRWELYNGTVWAELLPLATGKYSINVDKLDGYDAGNATGNIPISNGTVNVNLNADLLDGYQPGSAANQLLILDANASVPVASLPASGVALGTYRSVTVDAKGRVTDATNPTTIAGYGLTDAARINSPTFTGTPLSTTPTAGDNTTKIATTAYTQTALALKANLASPIFTGTVFLTNANASIKQLGADSLQIESAQNSIVTGKVSSYTVANAYWDGANWYSRDNLVASIAIQVDTVGNAVKVLTSAATAGIISWASNTLWHTGNDGALFASSTFNNSVTTAKLANDSVTTAKLADASVTTAKLVFDSGGFGYRNKIMGGDFTLNPWQRGASFAAAADAAYVADRWQYNKAGTAVHTFSKAADVPTALQAGFFTQHCLSAAVTTAQTTFAVGDLFIFQQKVEGFNATSFGFGQPGARSVTLSFWAKGAKTGIHCVSLRNATPNRSYIKEYTINSINTWEFKTLTIPVDTTGTWLYDNGIGIIVSFALATGTGFQTTANAWQAGNFLATANQVNELDTIGNTFKIALVQLEVGSIVTAFESRSVGQELNLCQRYYEEPLSYTRHVGTAAGFEGCVVNYAVTKRALPTISTKTVINSVNVASTSLSDHVTTSGSSFAVQSTNSSITNYAAILAVSAEL